MTYKIIDDSNEFTPKGNILLIALLDQNKEIHVCMNKVIHESIQNKSNLYELIAEKFEKGEGIKFQDYKCLIVNKDDIQSKLIQ